MQDIYYARVRVQGEVGSKYFESNSTKALYTMCIRYARTLAKTNQGSRATFRIRQDFKPYKSFKRVYVRYQHGEKEQIAY